MVRLYCLRSGEIKMCLCNVVTVVGLFTYVPFSRHPHVSAREKFLSNIWCRCYAIRGHLTLNIPSLARQRFLPSWGPRRTPWFFCNFSTVWCGRLLKLYFWCFWNYNSVIQPLLASNILCLFISTEVTGGTKLLHTLITHPASEQCHLLSIVGGLFFKFTTFRT